MDIREIKENKLKTILFHVFYQLWGCAQLCPHFVFAGHRSSPWIYLPLLSSLGDDGSMAGCSGHRSSHNDGFSRLNHEA